MTAQPTVVSGVAAGVPFLAVPPAGPAREDPPVVVAWHLLDPPRTEAALAAALPLAGLPAWRVYLGLPLSGSRLPAGGEEEIMRLGYEDAVRNLHGPIPTRAAAEFPAALAELRDRLDLGHGPLAVLGGSSGAAAAQLVILDSGRAAGPAVTAAVLISPVIQLRPLVEGVSRQYGVSYPWRPESLEIARRLDFVARADETTKNGQPAVRIVVGADDDRDGVLEPARLLRAALAERYDDPARVDLAVVPDMVHALAEEPGIEPAPQTTYAAAVDRLAVDWLGRHLIA